MKRILYILLLALISISAIGQTLTVASVEAAAGEETELVVTAADMTNITALQFNISLPEGVTFSESEVTKGAAVNGHTLNVQTLANGDRLFILYNMNLNRFSDGELLRIPVNVIDDAKTGKGRIYAIRTSTIDAVSYSSIASEYTITVKEPVVSYKLIYMIDGKEYKSFDVEYGSAITPQKAPIKKGYTFSGWSEIPATMPAKDVVVTGTFSVNSYKLTYMIDGKEYKSYDVEYGSAITPQKAPIKKGYTFSGWSEIPATMPAKDVTVTGTFSVNSYKLTYMVDDKEYKSYEVEYGSSITPEQEPTMEGYIFSGWSEIPETMPAKDVVVTGTFTLDTTGIDDVYSNDDNKEYYTVDGVRIAQPNKGINIVKMSDGSIKKVFVK